jgi:hypothetical protein
LTDVWIITGACSSTAAAKIASMVKSLRMLKAATPYRSVKARSRISFIDTTGTVSPSGQSRQSGDPSHAYDRQICTHGGLLRTSLTRVHAGW